MSVKRKWLSRLTVGIITCSMLLTLVACGDTDDTTSTTSTTGEKIVIEYAGWDTKYVAYEMAERYEKDHPNIDIVIHDNHGEYMGNEYMTQLAATNEFPDIFNLENPEFPIKNKWVVDLKPYLAKEESLDIPQNLLDNGTYNGKTVMIPSSLFVQGFIVNKDLLKANNVTIPDYGWTIDEFVDIAEKTTKTGSTIGTNSTEQIRSHLPAQTNPELGWASFNETTKHYEFTPYWVDACNISKDLYDSKVTLNEQLATLGDPNLMEEGSSEKTKTTEDRKALSVKIVGEDDAVTAFFKGKIAMYSEYSWGLAFDDVALNPTYSGFEWDFYPFPVAKEGDISRPGFVQDSRGISTTCEHPAEAYDYLKYTTFSAEGSAARLDIIKNYDQASAKEKYPTWDDADLPATMVDTSIPITNDKQVLDDWIAYSEAPEGLQHIISNLDTGYADGYKIVPGHDPAYWLNAEKAFNEQVLYGTASPSDIAADLETKANQITDEAYAALEVE